MATPEIEALAHRVASITGHEVYAYGQSSYDGDACRTCAWQGHPKSGQRHAESTREAAIAEILQDFITKHDSDEIECTCGYGGFHEPYNPRCARNSI